jgi:ArsR family transcriptional regulator, arsenate/arsenite/antimonite-responsive transcriptional repressor
MEQLAQLYKALSEETRIRIMMLLTQGELCVCDVQAVLDEPQSKVSRHLAYLKHSGLVSSKRVGVWMHYLIKKSTHKTCKAQLAFLEEQLSKLPQCRADRLKLEQFQKQKGCKALPPPRRAGRRTPRKTSDKDSAPDRTGDVEKMRRK